MVGLGEPRGIQTGRTVAGLESGLSSRRPHLPVPITQGRLLEIADLAVLLEGLWPVPQHGLRPAMSQAHVAGILLGHAQSMPMLLDVPRPFSRTRRTPHAGHSYLGSLGGWSCAWWGSWELVAAELRVGCPWSCCCFCWFWTQDSLGSGQGRRL